MHSAKSSNPNTPNIVDTGDRIVREATSSIKSGGACVSSEDSWWLATRVCRLSCRLYYLTFLVPIFDSLCAQTSSNKHGTDHNNDHFPFV